MGEIGSGNNSSYPGALDTNTIPEVNSPAAGKTKARKEVVEDLTDGLIKVETELGTDPAGSLADVKTFLQTQHQTNGTHKSTHGPHVWIDAADYDTLTDAANAAIGKTLLISSSINLTLAEAAGGAVVIPATVLGVLVIAPGIIAKGSATSLTINAPVVGNPMHQWLSGFAAGEVTFAAGSIKKVYPQWWYSGTGTISVALSIACAAYSQVHIPKGSYTLSSLQISLNNNTHISGDGKDTVLTATTGIIGSGFGQLFYADTKDNISICDLKFNGAGYQAALFAAGATTDIRIEDNEIINCGTAATISIAVYIREDCNRVLIRNNYVYNCYMGIEAVRSDYVRVLHNIVDRIQAAGIYFWIGYYNIADGNIVSNCGDIGIDVEGGSGHIVCNNYVYSCKNGELALWADSYPGIGSSTSTLGLHNISYHSNIIRRYSTYVDLSGASQACAAYGAFTVFSVGDLEGAGHPNNNENLSFTGNKIFSSFGYGIFTQALAGTTHMAIMDNYVEVSNALPPIWINEANGLTVKGNVFVGTYVNDSSYSHIKECSDLVVSNNVWKYPNGKITESALYAYNTTVVTNVRYSNNDFYGVGQYALHVHNSAGGDITLSGNLLSQVPVTTGGLNVTGGNINSFNQRLLIKLDTSGGLVFDLQGLACFYGATNTENGPNFHGVLEIKEGSTRRNAYNLEFFRGLLYSRDGSGSGTGYLASATWYATFATGTITFVTGPTYTGNSFLDVIINH